MNVIILAGGYGYRMGADTIRLPKPLIKIGSKPILYHIIKIYINGGANKIIISAGYKFRLIEKYVKNLKLKVPVKVINTGLNTETGGRILLAKKYLDKNKDFMVSYGDGLANINFNKLTKSHKLSRKIGTVTAVRPIARFGEIIIKNNIVQNFKEKPQVTKGWVNGGFFIFKYSFIKFIKNKKSILEKDPLEKITKKKNLNAYKHNGFWQCMDTQREKKILTNLIKNNKIPWEISD